MRHTTNSAPKRAAQKRTGRETANISLKPDEKKWAREQTRQRGLDNVSAFVRQLFREEKERQAFIEAELVAGLRSGKSTILDAKEWETMRAEGRKRLAETRARK